MSFTVTPLREGKEEVFLSCKKDVFEFSRSPECTFTSGAICGSKAEIFSDTPHKRERIIQYCSEIQ